MTDTLTQRATEHLQQLCVTIPTRLVGTPGNHAATNYVADQLAECGFAVTQPRFDCMNWTHGISRLLHVDGTRFPVEISPYSRGCDASGSLRHASTLDELKALDADGTLLLLSGDLTREQLMPKNFPFYNPEHHQQLVALLEAKQPAAILAATDRDPGLAGGISPFPLIEDGDFDIPSCYMTVSDGARVAAHSGEEFRLQLDATRTAATGCNVIGLKGTTKTRMVFCAHIDAKLNTPGALDNATGVVILLLLAELLQAYDRQPTLELLIFNGEDYYSAPGEQLYVKQNQGQFDQISLAVNMDGVGHRNHETVFSLYGCPPALGINLRRAFATQSGIVEGPAWYQSDHSVFIQEGRPAAAVTSASFLDELTVEVTHTPHDRPELVDIEKLTAVAQALATFVDQTTGEREEPA